MKRSIGAKTIVFPAPVFIIGTYDKSGKPNAMAVAWGGICCSDPPCVGIALREATYTYGNIMERKAFTVSIPSEKYIKEADYVGIVSGRTEEKRAMRYHYAVPFGMQTEHADRGDRDEKVRTAFNFPFKPFILTSTSIGQEGLDFHLYCHEIYHWNLPSNPIDLEQREGRINRYKGHLIRKNARDMMSGMTQIDYSQDLWEQIFRYLDDKRRKEQAEQCGMIPYWIIEAGKNKIIRHILTLPMGKDIQKYKSVKNTLVSYRLVFGQPRQEDLIEYLENVHESIICDEQLLSRFLINLCPLIFTKQNGINNT